MIVTVSFQIRLKQCAKLPIAAQPFRLFSAGYGRASGSFLLILDLAGNVMTLPMLLLIYSLLIVNTNYSFPSSDKN